MQMPAEVKGPHERTVSLSWAPYTRKNATSRDNTRLIKSKYSISSVLLLLK
jgi:hypothetical protein